MADPAGDERTTETFRLIYRSRDLLPGENRKAALGELFTQARSNNKKRDICGALLVHGDRFVQVLEGEESAVREVFTRIEADPRHDSVTLLETGTVPGPVFGRWAMARVAKDGESDIPLIAHVDGIAPAAGRRTTADQEEVLSFMREAARGDAASVQPAG